MNSAVKTKICIILLITIFIIASSNVVIAVGEEEKGKHRIEVYEFIGLSEKHPDFAKLNGGLGQLYPEAEITITTWPRSITITIEGKGIKTGATPIDAGGTIGNERPVASLLRGLAQIGPEEIGEIPAEYFSKHQPSAEESEPTTTSQIAGKRARELERAKQLLEEREAEERARELERARQLLPPAPAKSPIIQVKEDWAWDSKVYYDTRTEMWYEADVWGDDPIEDPHDIKPLNFLKGKDYEEGVEALARRFKYLYIEGEEYRMDTPKLKTAFRQKALEWDWHKQLMAAEKQRDLAKLEASPLPAAKKTEIKEQVEDMYEFKKEPISKTERMRKFEEMLAAAAPPITFKDVKYTCYVDEGKYLSPDKTKELRLDEEGKPIETVSVKLPPTPVIPPTPPKAPPFTVSKKSIGEITQEGTGLKWQKYEITIEGQTLSVPLTTDLKKYIRDHPDKVKLVGNELKIEGAYNKKDVIFTIENDKAVKKKYYHKTFGECKHDITATSFSLSTPLGAKPPSIAEKNVWTVEGYGLKIQIEARSEKEAREKLAGKIKKQTGAEIDPEELKATLVSAAEAPPPEEVWKAGTTIIADEKRHYVQKGKEIKFVKDEPTAKKEANIRNIEAEIEKQKLHKVGVDSETDTPVIFDPERKVYYTTGWESTRGIMVKTPLGKEGFVELRKLGVTKDVPITHTVNKETGKLETTAIYGCSIDPDTLDRFLKQVGKEDKVVKTALGAKVEDPTGFIKAKFSTNMEKNTRFFTTYFPGTKIPKELIEKDITDPTKPKFRSAITNELFYADKDNNVISRKEYDRLLKKAEEEKKPEEKPTMFASPKSETTYDLEGKPYTYSRYDPTYGVKEGKPPKFVDEYVHYKNGKFKEYNCIIYKDPADLRIKVRIPVRKGKVPKETKDFLKKLGYSDKEIAHWEERAVGAWHRARSRRFFQTFEYLLTEYRGLRYFSSLLGEKKLRQWREGIDKIFSLDNLGIDHWTSAICKHKYDLNKPGVAYTETPAGMLKIQATVNGEKSFPIKVTGRPTEYFYKFTFYVKAMDEDLKFNVYLYEEGQEPYNLFGSDIMLKPGQEYKATGDLVIRSYSTHNYTQICLKGNVDKCNQIAISDYSRDNWVSSDSPEMGHPGGVGADPYETSQKQQPRTF